MVELHPFDIKHNRRTKTHICIQEEHFNRGNCFNYTINKIIKEYEENNYDYYLMTKIVYYKPKNV